MVRYWLILLAALAPAARAELPAPSSFFEKATVTGMRLSPDGKTLVAISSGELCIMSIAALDAGCARRIAVSPLAQFRWVGDTHLLANFRLAVPFSYIAVFDMARFELIDVTTGSSAPIKRGKGPLSIGEILWTARNGTSLLFSGSVGGFSGPVGVYRFDVASGSVTLVQPPFESVDAWFTDTAGTVRAGLAYQRDNKVVLYTRERAGDALRRSTAIQLKPGSAEESLLEALRFDGPGGTRLAMTNDRTGRFGVYRFDADTNTLGAALFEHPKVDADDLIVDPLSAEVVGVAFEDDRPRVKWLSPQAQALQDKIDKALPNALNRIVDRSRDGRLVLIKSGGPSNPDIYYLLDTKTQKMGSLLPAFRDRGILKLAPMEAIEYIARDGLPIPAYLTTPVDRAAKALPLIVMPHGGPFLRDHWEFNPYVQFLASRGYAVLQPQFRGSTGYGRTFAERGYGQWGRAMQDDLLDGIDALAAKGVVDPKRVCIVGGSYGGYAAMWAAARDGAHYRCAVSMAGISDLRAMLRHDNQHFYARRYARDWREKVTGVEKFDLASVSPLKQQAAITIPILIEHGELDTNVPPSQSHALVRVLKRRGAIVESVFYENEGHGLNQRANQADFATRLETFLSKYNPSDASSVQ